MKQLRTYRHRSASGFTLVELMVALAIFGILMTMVFSSFIPVLQTNTKESRISETKLETGIGLDLLRSDLEHAGFGLPWNFAGMPNPYNEPSGDTTLDATDDATTNAPPRALSSVDATAYGMNNGSDYLVVKAMNVTSGTTSQKWGWLWRNGTHTFPSATIQSMGAEPFNATDRVIVINPRDDRQLVVDGAALNNFFATTTPAALDNFAPAETGFDPDGERYLLYGLNDTASAQRPFNRTDYYINNANVPAHCAPGTGVLTKWTLNQADNNFAALPIVDCVADFQVVYYLDTSTPLDGGWDTRANANGLAGMNAEEVRQRVKSVRCYILTHQGGVDRNYIHPTQNINVGEVAADGVTLQANAGRVFNLNANIGATWANYRWQVYSLAVTPRNLQ
ncbi:MAG: prepilin-type N-terminal cleavage/methylation domain-containing protein [Pseudomonadota bacterium]